MRAGAAGGDDRDRVRLLIAPRESCARNGRIVLVTMKNQVYFPAYHLRHEEAGVLEQDVGFVLDAAGSRSVGPMGIGW